MNISKGFSPRPRDPRKKSPHKGRASSDRQTLSKSVPNFPEVAFLSSLRFAGASQFVPFCGHARRNHHTGVLAHDSHGAFECHARTVTDRAVERGQTVRILFYWMDSP